MSTPLRGDIHVNRPLTNISIAYFQSEESFVAARVFPNISVSKQSDRYFVYNRADFNRDEMRVRAPSTESAGGGYRIDNTPTYFADVRAFHKDIPDEMRANADVPLQLDREATIYCTHKALINREQNFATRFFSSSASWSNSATGVDSSPTAGQFLRWNDPTSTPIEDVRAGKRVVHKGTGYRPNVLTLGRETFDALLDHPDIIDRVKYGQTAPGAAMATRQILATLFEVDEVTVMDSVINTAAEPAAEASTFIGGPHALLTYRPNNPGIMTPSAGYIFSWNGFLAAGAAGNRIRQFRMDHINSDRTEIDSAYDMKMVGADLGYFFETAVVAT